MPSQTIANLSPATFAASKDTSNAQHHSALGQVLATVLTGAEDALIAYTDPANLEAAVMNFVSSFIAIWVKPPQTSPN